jgi:hypothetical protein
MKFLMCGRGIHPTSMPPSSANIEDDVVYQGGNFGMQILESTYFLALQAKIMFVLPQICFS